jgi:hypothetical protein
LASRKKDWQDDKKFGYGSVEFNQSMVAPQGVPGWGDTPEGSTSGFLARNDRRNLHLSQHSVAMALTVKCFVSTLLKKKKHVNQMERQQRFSRLAWRV